MAAALATNASFGAASARECVVSTTMTIGLRPGGQTIPA